MNSYTFHINLYDLASLGTIFIGLNFGLQLWFTKSSSPAANRFLAMALGVMVLWMGGLLGADLHLWTSPLQLSMAFGPLIYFYVRKTTRPAQRFSWKDLMHFVPVLLEQAFWLSGIASLIKPLTFISIATYLYLSHRLIEQFYRSLKFNEGDRYRLEWRWLDQLLAGLGLVLLLWIPLTAIDYFVYHFTLSMQAYYPLCLLMAITVIRLGAIVVFRTGIDAFAQEHLLSKSSASLAMKQKGSWLRKTIETGLLYQDAELSVSSLAEQLNIPAHELSRIINAAFKKNFNDFINEYRIREVVRKMQDPAYDRLTLLGIAYESGFNSKSTFNRTFREMTGENPAQYKSNLKKEGPFSNLEPRYGNGKIVLHHETHINWFQEKLNRIRMFSNYFKIAWRNLAKSKGYTLINISGLAVGMAVAILIGLWINDELSYNTSLTNYSRIASVKQSQDFSGVMKTNSAIPAPLGEALRAKFGSEFKHVVMSSWNEDHVLATGDKNITRPGSYMEAGAPEMLDLKMIRGSQKALADPNSILLCQSAAEALFGKADPMGKTINIDKWATVKVAGIYENLPRNTSFTGIRFIASWDLYSNGLMWVKRSKQNWGNNSFQTFVQLNDKANIDQVNAKIKNIKYDMVKADEKKFKAVIFLYPISRWHLYDDYKNGHEQGLRMQFVWLFGIVGVFVLILACINFMNLSTARSEKRAKEVGIRKTMGSMRAQLIGQFFSESLMVVILAFIISLMLVQLSLPLFNGIAAKQISILWTNSLFWLSSLGFILFTGIVAGSYPALYLSSFQPVKVLKGTFRAGRFASLPRKVLVVVQFSVSIVLIIGTLIVFRQIQFAKDRPVGYDREGLITVGLNTDDIHDHFDAVRADLLKTGAVEETSESTSPVTGVYSNDSGFDWKGKDPAQTVNFGVVTVRSEYGRTVGWKFTDGRDFSNKLASDTMGLVINEAAANLIGFKQAAGKSIKWGDEQLTIIGVIKNMVMESPYAEARPIVFHLGRDPMSFLNIKLKAGTNLKESLAKIEAVFKRYVKDVPFDYTFADSDYAGKFASEERVGKLASLFACLAIFISCLGLFGMASFTAEQRTKEIGVRKVLGATVADLWKMLSTEFVILVLISCLIGAPIATWFLHKWLQSYEYRTEISWWIFAVSAGGALIITLITVSFQAIKAALANPVKSLRSE